MGVDGGSNADSGITGRSRKLEERRRHVHARGVIVRETHGRVGWYRRLIATDNRRRRLGRLRCRALYFGGLQGLVGVVASRGFAGLGRVHRRGER